MRKLSTKIVSALLGFLFLALVAVGTTLFLSWQLEGSAAAINEAGSLRMQGYRLSMLAGQSEAERQIASINATFARLRTGDPQRPLFLPPDRQLLTRFDDVEREWHNDVEPLARAADQRLLQVRLDEFVRHVNGLVFAIEQDSEARTLWLRASQLTLLGMALAGTVSLIYLMFLMIVEPVRRLGEGMARMKAQDFDARVEVDSDDEFGELARGFNEMADYLQGMYSSLEERVRAKTEALETQNRELALLYSSAAFLQTPLPLEELCQGFMERITRYFKADGSSVRVLDAARGNLHMVAHSGISKELAEEERCLKVGQCLCGSAAEQRVAVVYDLRELERGPQLRCRKEGFATVSVFHIHAHKQHIGFFTLHFREARTFTRDEQSMLEALGRMLGIAIENVRLAERDRELAVVEERNLVAQGLHDSIAQGLNFLNLQVQMLESSMAAGRMDQVAEVVPNLRAGVKESYEDVRELLHNFRSRLVEDSLVDAIRATIDKFEHQTGIAVKLVADADGAPFPREQQLQLLFIVQEALSNVRKHAMASRAEIRIEDRNEFRLAIADNGVGFDTSAKAGETHVGLVIMAERAARLGAGLDIKSTLGQGTTIEVRLAHAQRRVA